MTTGEYAAEFLNKERLNLSERQISQLDIYYELLIQKNKVMNLTAITDTEGVAIKHFYDSLTPLIYTDIDEGSTVVDVGTGAGFPAIPLLIARPDLKLTMMDSLNKRLLFLVEVCEQLDINARIVHSRAEEAGKNKLYREKFDYAVSRAVAALPILCEYCLPLVKPSGKFIAMKGSNADSELKLSGNAIKQLGGELENIKKFKLPTGETRALIIIRKVANTPLKFPRHASKIAKESL